jgi:hypothetical protein
MIELLAFNRSGTIAKVFFSRSPLHMLRTMERLDRMGVAYRAPRTMLAVGQAV